MSQIQTSSEKRPQGGAKGEELSHQNLFLHLLVLSYAHWQSAAAALASACPAGNMAHPNAIQEKILKGRSCSARIIRWFFSLACLPCEHSFESVWGYDRFEGYDQSWERTVVEPSQSYEIHYRWCEARGMVYSSAHGQESSCFEIRNVLAAVAIKLRQRIRARLCCRK